jgi:hypothetical protein
MERRSDGEEREQRGRFSPIFQYSNTPTLRLLLSMWTSRRMMKWFLVAVVVQMLVRVPFLPVQMIPRHLDFQPGIVFIPLGAVFFGPAGVWGALAASLLGDRLFGQWNALSWFRAAGSFFFALGTMRLWDFTVRRAAPAPELTRSWLLALRFTFVTWPGCFLAASWRGIGSELVRAYPYAYIVSLLVLNHLLFCTLLGSMLYRLMTQYWVPRVGIWREAMPQAAARERTSWTNAFFVTAGGIGACLAGLFVSRAVYHMGPLQPFRLGSATGILVPIVVFVFLLVQAVGALRRNQQKGPG